MKRHFLEYNGKPRISFVVHFAYGAIAGCNQGLIGGCGKADLADGHCLGSNWRDSRGFVMAIYVAGEYLCEDVVGSANVQIKHLSNTDDVYGVGQCYTS